MTSELSFLDRLDKLTDCAMAYAEKERKVANVPTTMEFQIQHIKDAIKERRLMMFGSAVK